MPESCTAFEEFTIDLINNIQKYKKFTISINADKLDIKNSLSI